MPTVAEAGHKALEYELWFGIFAPANTPADILSRLAGWFADALRVPEARSKLIAQGLNPIGLCGTDFAALLRQQNEHYRRALLEANIKVE